MYDCYNRNINYLRVSVTDRCNLRCRYCMPESGVKLLDHSEILSFEEIFETVKYGVSQGITKVRITGGEPLVRKDIVKLVGMIAEIDGVIDLAMTTNGTLLEKFAADLAKAGLMRINISLDSLNPLRYNYITRNGQLKDVLKGIEATANAGLSPIKLNCVIQNNADEPDALMVKQFAEKNGFEVRFIRQMNLATGEFYTFDGGTGGNCPLCNRLRLSANGNLKPCLFSDIGYNVRKLGISKAYKLALENKPLQGKDSQDAKFYNIGG